MEKSTDEEQRSWETARGRAIDVESFHYERYVRCDDEVRTKQVKVIHRQFIQIRPTISLGRIRRV